MIVKPVDCQKLLMVVFSGAPPSQSCLVVTKDCPEFRWAVVFCVLAGPKPRPAVHIPKTRVDICRKIKQRNKPTAVCAFVNENCFFATRRYE